ncbi:hypothetical protein [Lonsdalea britannica]|nr:hypothetical protein [Lonsdalea britannica]
MIFKFSFDVAEKDYLRKVKKEGLKSYRLDRGDTSTPEANACG